MPVVEPANGPCALWVEATALSCECEPADATPATALELEAVQVASELLFVLSGQQFPGVCTKTVLLLDECGAIPRDRMALRGWDDFVTPGDFPLLTLTDVNIDGVAQDLADYQILNHTRVIRRTTAPVVSGNQATSMTYTFGQVPPASGVSAANKLACELVAACVDPDLCSLPRNVISITRAGMSAVLTDPFALLEQGKLGLFEVDGFLLSYNPGQLRSPTMVVTPDTINRVAVQTWSTP